MLNNLNIHYILFLVPEFLSIFATEIKNSIMVIQSLSIVVPTKGCMNSCRFCVSRMRKDNYPDLISKHMTDEEKFYYTEEYKKRLSFARDNGCNTVMLTGQGEPQQNMSFIKRFYEMNNELAMPFRNIEIQTTGASIHEATIIELRNYGISTISLSVSCLNDIFTNSDIINYGKNPIDVPSLCCLIKKYNINLRLSLNMTDMLFLNNRNHDDNPEFKEIFSFCKSLGADQVTFRKMYMSSKYTPVTPQDQWINEHNIIEYNSSCDWFTLLNKYIIENGKYLDTLEYGNSRYSVDEMSVVVDNDCMSKNSQNKTALKYLILRPNCKLYSKWDDKGSLIF